MELPLTVVQRCHHDYEEVNKVKTDIESCVLIIDQYVPPRSYTVVNVICDSLDDPSVNTEDVFGIKQNRKVSLS